MKGSPRGCCDHAGRYCKRTYFAIKELVAQEDGTLPATGWRRRR